MKGEEEVCFRRTWEGKGVRFIREGLVCQRKERGGVWEIILKKS